MNFENSMQTRLTSDRQAMLESVAMYHNEGKALVACKAKRLMQVRGQSFLVRNDARSHRYYLAGFPGLSGKNGHGLHSNAHIIVR